MVMPHAYRHTSEEFESYLADCMEISGLATFNQVYTMTEGVFLAFRRRLSCAEVLQFASLLPAVLRALFISGWSPDEGVSSFGDRESMAAEVRHVRRDHNFSTGTAIADVATALRRHVDVPAFERMLRKLPSGAVEFWSAT